MPPTLMGQPWTIVSYRPTEISLIQALLDSQKRRGLIKLQYVVPAAERVTLEPSAQQKYVHHYLGYRPTEQHSRHI
jgi:hypothetical protein